VAVTGGGTAVLAAWETGTGDCFGVLDITASSSRSVLGETAPGVYYFVARRIPAARCDAAAPAATSVSTTGFP
jgi:hypothetical protein